jgi:hypothetical protein
MPAESAGHTSLRFYLGVQPPLSKTESQRSQAQRSSARRDDRAGGSGVSLPPIRRSSVSPSALRAPGAVRFGGRADRRRRCTAQWLTSLARLALQPWIVILPDPAPSGRSSSRGRRGTRGHDSHGDGPQRGHGGEDVEAPRVRDACGDQRAADHRPADADNPEPSRRVPASSLPT